MLIEYTCAHLLRRLEKKPQSIRFLIEKSTSVPRSLLHALCMGVLKKYRLVEEALRLCGYKGSLRRGTRDWLAIIAGYEAMFRESYVEAERIINLLRDPSVFSCLKRIDEKDVWRRYQGLRRLAIRYSIPEWVVSKLSQIDHPGGLELLFESFEKPPPIWLRINKAKLVDVEKALRLLEEIGIVAREDPVLDDVVEVIAAKPGAVEKIDKKLFYVMDRASCLVAHMVEEPGSLLDLFSAPGNKLAHVIWRSRTLFALAIDLSPRRITEEKKLLEVQNVWEVSLVAADALHLPIKRNKEFDAAIIDPDCSSIGRLGHSPETRLFLEKAGPIIVSRLAKIQRQGLKQAISMVKPGGVIVYSTCTLTRDENEDVIDSILSEYRRVELEEATPWIGVPSPIYPKTQRLYPHISRSIGAFIAKLRKT